MSNPEDNPLTPEENYIYSQACLAHDRCDDSTVDALLAGHPHLRERLAARRPMLGSPRWAETEKQVSETRRAWIAAFKAMGRFGLRCLEKQIRAIYPASVVDRIAATTTADVSRTEIRRVLKTYRDSQGLKRLQRSRDLETVILAENKRIQSIRQQRRDRAVVSIPGSFTDRFAAWKRNEIEKAIERALIYYRTSRGIRTQDTVQVRYGEPTAEVKREARWTSPRSHNGPNWPDYYDWVWTVTVRPGWRRDVLRRLGGAVADGLLVLDVVGEIRTEKEGEQAYRILVMVQGRGASVRAEERIIYRMTGQHPWRLATMKQLTRYDRILGREHSVRRPAGYRSR